MARKRPPFKLKAKGPKPPKPSKNEDSARTTAIKAPSALDKLPTLVLRNIAFFLVPHDYLSFTSNLTDLSHFARTCRSIKAEVNGYMWEKVYIYGDLKPKVILNTENFRFIRVLVVEQTQGLLDMLPCKDDKVWKMIQKLPNLEDFDVKVDTHQMLGMPSSHNSAATTPSFPKDPSIVFPKLKRIRVVIIANAGSLIEPAAYVPSYYKKWLDHDGKTPHHAFPVVEKFALVCPEAMFGQLTLTAGVMPGVKVAEMKTMGFARAMPFEAARGMFPNIEELEAGCIGPVCMGNGCMHRGATCVCAVNVIHWTSLHGLHNLREVRVTLSGDAFTPGPFGNFSTDSLASHTEASRNFHRLYHFLDLQEVYKQGELITPETTTKAVKELATHCPSLRRVTLMLSSDDIHAFGFMPPCIWHAFWDDARCIEAKVSRRPSGKIKVSGVCSFVQHCDDRVVVPINEEVVKIPCPDCKGSRGDMSACRGPGHTYEYP